jgi:hypothetical protein
MIARNLFWTASKAQEIGAGIFICLTGTNPGRQTALARIRLKSIPDCLVKYVGKRSGSAKMVD